MHALAFTHEVRGVSSSSLHEGLILTLRGSGLRLDASQPGHAQLSEPVGEPNSRCRLSASLSFLNSRDGVLLLCLVKVLDADASSDQGSGYYLAARLQDIQKVIENRLRGLGADVRSRSGDPGRARRTRGDVISRAEKGSTAVAFPERTVSPPMRGAGSSSMPQTDDIRCPVATLRPSLPSGDSSPVIHPWRRWIHRDWPAASEHFGGWSRQRSTRAKFRSMT